MKMNHKSKKFLPFLITVAIVAGLFAAMPLTASAKSASQLVSDIINYNIANGSHLIATASGNTVTVTGSCESGYPTKTLNLNIDAGVTVEWKASFIGSNSTALLNTSGPGTFVFANGALIQAVCCGLYAGGDVRVEGGEINTTGGYAINLAGANSSIIMSGGKINSEKTAINSGKTITITGGKIVAGGAAVNTLVAGATVTITGVELISNGGSAGVYVGGNASSLKITDSRITTTNATQGVYVGDNMPCFYLTNSEISSNRRGIWIGTNSTLLMRGGTVTTNSTSANEGAIYTSATNAVAAIDGGTVTNTGAGPAINCGNGAASVQGINPRVIANSGYAICARNVTVCSGLVESACSGNYSSATIYSNYTWTNSTHNVNIYGGTVRNTAKDGFAVDSTGLIYVEIGRGVVVEATGLNGKQYNTRGANGIAIEWTGSYDDEYVIGTSDELVVYGTGASAWWGFYDDEYEDYYMGYFGGGIRYQRGASKGHISLGVHLANHVHVYEDMGIAPLPTCTIWGSHNYACSYPGCEWTKSIGVESLGHDWDEGVVTTPATSTTTGVKTYTCMRPSCGATKTEKIGTLPSILIPLRPTPVDLFVVTPFQVSSTPVLENSMQASTIQASTAQASSVLANPVLVYEN